MNDPAKVLSSLLKDVTPCRENVGIAFSGGLDSGIIAHILRDCNPHLYTVGVEGSKDFENSISSTSKMGLDVSLIEINEHDILEGIIFLKRVDPKISAVEVSFELPLYFVCSRTDKIFIYTGQGSDELFGGYRKYLERPQLMKDDLKKLMKKTIPRERKMATLLGKELVTPYLHVRVIEFAANLPLEMKIRDGVRKWILREAGKYLGVSEDIVKRDKKAAQYGSGVWKLMKKMAKERNLSVEDFVSSL